MTRDFINDNINHQEFISFFVNGKILNKPIQFHCDNIKAAKLVYTLKDECYDNFNITKVFKIQVFKGRTDKKLTNNDLKSTKNRIPDEEFDTLREDFTYLKKNAQKS